MEKRIEVSVLCFGITKDLVGKQRLMLQLPMGISVAGLKNELQSQYPELSEINSVAIAVNSEYALDDQEINDRDEVALIPPVSGG